MDNRQSQVYCDKVNYAVCILEEFKEYSDIIFCLMNSITFRFFLDLFSRQMAGSLSDIDVNVVEKTLILNPSLLKNKKKEIAEILKSLKSREQKSIHNEILESDKRKIDELIFEALGLDKKDVDELYKSASEYVKSKKAKTDSLVTKKSKASLTIEDSFKLIQERFSDIQKYSSLLKGLDNRKIDVPDWKAKYPKEGINTHNLFGFYNVYFIQGNKQIQVSFEHPEQLALFEFLNQRLEVKGLKLTLPKSKQDCNRILTILENEYEENISLIRGLLKTHRSKANPTSIYRDLILD